jgi:hypothetical protein
MVAVIQPLPQTPVSPRPAEGRSSALAQLKLLHAEAEETARLANLLGRSLYVGLALPVLGVLTIGLADEVSPVSQLVWCGFVAAVSIALLIAYRHAMRQPFERAALKNFARDLSAILLFAGFAWGAGAFLALPPGTNAVAAILFAAAPAIAVSTLLQQREALFLFLAPAAALAAAGSLLKPFANGTLEAGLILAVSAVIAGAAVLREHWASNSGKPAMLSFP